MLLCLVILKMLLLSWFTSKNCLRIPVVMVPCSVWKLKWTKKMVLGKQGLKIRLSISGCPSSSCRGQMFGNKEKSNSNSISKDTCTVNVVQVLTKKLTAWERSLFPLTKRKKGYMYNSFTIFWSTLSQNPRALPMIIQSCTNHWGFIQGPRWCFTNGSAVFTPQH